MLLILLFPSVIVRLFLMKQLRNMDGNNAMVSDIYDIVDGDARTW